MDSEEYKNLCFRKNHFTERLKNDQNESEIKKLKDKLEKIEEDINKIQNQRNSKSRVQELSSFYKKDEINQKIKDLETKKKQNKIK